MKKIAAQALVDNGHGLSKKEFEIFGDRVPPGFSKVRLLSKMRNQVLWILQLALMQKPSQPQYHIVQQIPRCHESFEQMVKGFKDKGTDLYEKINKKIKVKKLAFEISEILDEPNDPDVWVVYEPTPDLLQYRSLQDCLFSISIQTQKSMISYQVKHSAFFKVLAQKEGKEHLGQFIKTLCELLSILEGAGAVCANLRPENILIKFNDEQSKIENVKFIGLKNLVSAKEAQ